MKYLRMLAILALPLWLFLSVPAQEPAAEQRGELQIYPLSTQIGVVALREFKDSKGRVTKSIYYNGGGNSAPFREDLLTEYCISVTTYGADDCAVKGETYWPGMKLAGSVETKCWPGTSTPQVMTMRNARGIRTQETRKTDEGSDETVILFDVSGKNVIGFKGQTPADVDLFHGWGEEVGGFVCGIAANLERGRQEQIEVAFTLKNISYKEDHMAHLSPFAIELRDSLGKVIEPKAEQAKIAANACTPAVESYGPDLGESDQQDNYRLDERYNRLAPGQYAMTVKFCSTASAALLISNTIVIEIAAPTNLKSEQRSQKVAGNR